LAKVDEVEGSRTKRILLAFFAVAIELQRVVRHGELLVLFYGTLVALEIFVNVNVLLAMAFDTDKMVVMAFLFGKLIVERMARDRDFLHYSFRLQRLKLAVDRCLICRNPLSYELLDNLGNR